jgi:hypothetical protein
MTTRGWDIRSTQGQHCIVYERVNVCSGRNNVFQEYVRNNSFTCNVDGSHSISKTFPLVTRRTTKGVFFRWLTNLKFSENKLKFAWEKTPTT